MWIFHVWNDKRDLFVKIYHISQNKQLRYNNKSVTIFILINFLSLHGMYLKSVCIHFAYESDRRSFLVEYS